MIYMVEHDFETSHPEIEAKWNEWYSDHATYSFRKVPGWRTGQRFVAMEPSGPKYRAFYTLDSSSVLDSKEYKATTGGRFPEEYRPLIVDFHRNLADGDWMPAVEHDQCLIVVDPPATGKEIDGVELTWWNMVGLEKTVPKRAIGVVSREVGSNIAKMGLNGIAAYEPVFERWQI